MKIGFTGTRLGMTNPQKRTIASILSWYASHENATEFHHGNCVGADEQAAKIADSHSYITVSHPAEGLDHYQSTYKSDVTLPARPPLKRNKDIVRHVNLLIACPKEEVEPPPSRGQGTWSCIRFARHFKISYYENRIVIIWPNGECTT